MLLATPLFVCSYVLVGGGIKAEGRYGAVAITVGMPLYFVSLTIARRTRLNWFIVLVAYIGALVGLLIVLFTAADAFGPRYDFWFLSYVTFVLLVNIAGYFALVRRKASGAGLQTWRGF